VDPRAMMGTAPEPMQKRAVTAAAVRLARLPLPSGQRGAPTGTRARGEYTPMPSLVLRH
jgi:hypothetical protein